MFDDSGNPGQNPCGAGAGMVLNHRAELRPDDSESEGDASERIFHAGENPHVLARIPRIVAHVSADHSISF
jgi:hypothetical protein